VSTSLSQQPLPLRVTSSLTARRGGCGKKAVNYEKAKRKGTKTYNTRDSPVVTHPSTNLAITGLSMGERTGSRVFLCLWSYVSVFGPGAIILWLVDRGRRGEDIATLRIASSGFATPLSLKRTCGMVLGFALSIETMVFYTVGADGQHRITEHN
jgi:hypothetical protein